MSAIRIRCAVCDKLVDRVTVSIDPIERTQSVRVDCHGAVERMSVGVDQMRNWTHEERIQWGAIALGQKEGVAFTTPQIGESNG